MQSVLFKEPPLPPGEFCGTPIGLTQSLGEGSRKLLSRNSAPRQLLLRPSPGVPKHAERSSLGPGPGAPSLIARGATESLSWREVCAHLAIWGFEVRNGRTVENSPKSLVKPNDDRGQGTRSQMFGRVTVLQLLFCVWGEGGAKGRKSRWRWGRARGGRVVGELKSRALLRAIRRSTVCSPGCTETWAGHAQGQGKPFGKEVPCLGCGYPL